MANNHKKERNKSRWCENNIIREFWFVLFSLAVRMAKRDEASKVRFEHAGMMAVMPQDDSEEHLDEPDIIDDFLNK